MPSLLEILLFLYYHISNLLAVAVRLFVVYRLDAIIHPIFQSLIDFFRVNVFARWFPTFFLGTALGRFIARYTVEFIDLVAWTFVERIADFICRVWWIVIWPIMLGLLLLGLIGLVEGLIWLGIMPPPQPGGER